jgi:hypothetical protein
MNPGSYLSPDTQSQPQPITNNMSNSRTNLPNINIPSNTGNMFYNSASNILTTPSSAYPYPHQPTPTTERSTPPLTHTSTTSDDKAPRAEEAAKLMRFVPLCFPLRSSHSCIPSSHLISYENDSNLMMYDHRSSFSTSLTLSPFHSDPQISFDQLQEEPGIRSTTVPSSYPSSTNHTA